MSTGSGAVEVFTVTLVGVSVTTGVKLAFTLTPVVVVLTLRALVLVALRRALGGRSRTIDASGPARA